MTMKALGAAVALATLLFGAGVAWCHAFLDHAEPRVGSTVTAAPPLLTLVFTEAIELAFSHVEVLDDRGKGIPIAPLAHPAGETITVPLPALPPGRYTVQWAVVSVDTHSTEGRFEFSVKHP